MAFELPLNLFHLLKVPAGVLGEGIQPLVQVDLAQAVDRHADLTEYNCTTVNPSATMSWQRLRDWSTTRNGLEVPPCAGSYWDWRS